MESTIIKDNTESLDIQFILAKGSNKYNGMELFIQSKKGGPCHKVDLFVYPGLVYNLEFNRLLMYDTEDYIIFASTGPGDKGPEGSTGTYKKE